MAMAVNTQPEGSPTRAESISKGNMTPSIVDADHIEDGQKSGLFSKYIHAGLGEDDARFLANYSKEDEKTAFRKVDYRFVAPLEVQCRHELTTSQSRSHAGYAVSHFPSGPCQPG
jgi:hypothetical protein